MLASIFKPVLGSKLVFVPTFIQEIHFEIPLLLKVEYFF